MSKKSTIDAIGDLRNWLNESMTTEMEIIEGCRPAQTLSESLRAETAEERLRVYRRVDKQLVGLEGTLLTSPSRTAREGEES